MMDALYKTLDSSEFRLYSCPEILQLSVKEITQTRSFDLLENVMKNGPHDLALGPTHFNERCHSCGQSERNCPGHFGHIKLPVMIYNPILFKTLVPLLQGTCMACHTIMLPSIMKDAFVLAIGLLHKGIISDAQVVMDFLKTKHFPEERQVNMDHFSRKYKDVRADKKLTSKHILTLMKDVLALVTKRLKQSSRQCLYCEQKNRTLTAQFNCFIVGSLVKRIKKVKTEKSETVSKLVKDMKGETHNDAVALVEEHVELDVDEPKPTTDDVINEMDGLDDEGSALNIEAEIDQFLNSTNQRCILSPHVAQHHLKGVWKKDETFLKAILPFLAQVSGLDAATDVFFQDVVIVTPSRFRPINLVRGSKFEHQQTTRYAKIILACEILKSSMATYSTGEGKTEDDNVKGLTVEEPKPDMAAVMRSIMSTWAKLQTLVNSIYDSTLDKSVIDGRGGVRQLLDKKQGLFRMNMMGKRVNFAARSVISPDPYIDVNQIGIPLIFASKLTYPQRVTPWNVHMLRQLVLNGPNKYPGAFSVVNEDGSITNLSSKDGTQREAVANQLLVPDKNISGYKTVCRHLLNGDYLLLNRQPTLHRPSIQAHKARVLGGIKTLRMHYSNCKAYNADFDGDEMNVHFPQDEIGRAEAATLACTDYQYLVPKDGTPLGGLIQDHMVAGVRLTTRGRFFDRHEYCSLVWGAMNDWPNKLELLPPAILKPKPLWSGKQVISTVILNIIPKDQTPLNLQSRAKIPEKSWTSPEMAKHPKMNELNLKAWASIELGESTVVIRQGELLQGVLDKAHYGPSSYGLVHGCYELYGGIVAGKLLTYLGRLFTTLLQTIGFSLGVGDILVVDEANEKRKSIIRKSLTVGNNATCKALSLSPTDEVDDIVVREGLKQAQFGKDKFKLAEIDLCMKRETDQIQDSISKCIMPAGLEKKFPENSLQLMVQSGAKGSPVNCMQISCLLGQIELEGRRPPLMLSGRSLPCFLPYDMSPQAGGFVSGRFLTGIRPAEYFFHCMAGREGLIDTAVKTSRSGYLQRCLVKHLEGAMVNYDMTVRDSDGCVLQFYYGEDGLDPCRSTYLKPSQFPFLTGNLTALQGGRESPWLSPDYSKSIKRTWKKISKLRAQTSESGSWMNRANGFLDFCNTSVKIRKSDRKTLMNKGNYRGRSQASKLQCEAWYQAYDENQRRELYPSKACPDPVMSRHLPHSQPDVMSESFRHSVKVYCKKGLDEVMSQAPSYAKIDQDMFTMAINKKLVKSMVHPGEAVGLLCAQSIGEPSTQMTLNTFHFAGRGEMNVTLGIPRMREVLMTGSKMPKTPQVDVPIRPIPDARKQAERLAAMLTKATLSQLLDYMKVKITTVSKGHLNFKNVEINFKFLRHSHYRDICDLKYKSIVEYVIQKFIPMVIAAVKKEKKILDLSTLLTTARMVRSAATTRGDEQDATPKDDEEEDEDLAEMQEEPNDGDAETMKEQQRHTDTNEYEGEDEEREVVEGNNEDAEQEEIMSEDEEEEDSASEDELQMEYVIISNLSTEHGILWKRALSHDEVIDLQFEEEKKRSFTVTFQYPPDELQFDLRLMLERLANVAIVQQVKNINKAIITEEIENGETVLHLKTDGINIQHLFKYPDLLDLNRIYSNSISHILEIYGIEAANRVIIKEVQNVFGAYGITVDYRHLSLLADYMTNRGMYDSCDRIGIGGNQTSSYQKITYETSMAFLRDACLNATRENLQSPSSRIVVGKPIAMGTGCFDILTRH